MTIAERIIYNLPQSGLPNVAPLMPKFVLQVRQVLYEKYRKQLCIRSLSGKPLDLAAGEDYVTLSLMEEQEKEAEKNTKKQAAEKEIKKVSRPLPNWHCLYGNSSERPKLKSTQFAHRYGITAPPGGGKSTLLGKMLVDNLSKTPTWAQFEWVILFRCRDLVRAYQKEHIDEQTTLAELIYHFYLKPLVRINEYAYSEGQLKLLAQAITQETDKLLLLIDGLDEYQQTDAFQQLYNMLLSVPHIVISGRPQAMSRLLTEDSVAEINIKGFSPEAVEAYIARYFKQDGASQAVLQEIIKRHDIELVRNPVCLESLCFIIGESKNKRQLQKDLAHLSLSELYKLVVFHLLKRHMVRRTKKDENNITSAVVQRSTYRKFLGELAAEMFEQNQTSIKYEQYDVILEKSCHVTDSAEKRDILQSGLLRGNGEGLWYDQDYEFLHLTFQEYLAAFSFVERFRIYVDSEKASQSTTAFQHFFNRHKYHERYLRFWQFVMGMVSQELQLFNQFEQFWCGVLSFQERDEERELSTQLLQGFAFHCDVQLKEQIAAQFSGILQSTVQAKGWRKSDALATVGALGSVLAENREFVSGLLAALTDEEWTVRSSAAEVIEQLGPVLAENSDVVSGLLAALADKKRNVRTSAVEVIGKLGPVLADNSAVVSGLLAALTDKEWSVRDSAAKAIGALGPVLAGNSAVVLGLATALADEEWSARASAAEAIGRLGPVLADDAAFVSSLLVMLTDNAIDVRINAAETIGALGPALAGNAEIVLGLAEVLADKSWGGPTDIEKILRALEKKMEEMSADIGKDRPSAANVTDALDPALAENVKSMSSLAKVLADEETWVRRRAIGAIRKLGPALMDNAAFVSGLLEVLTDKRIDVRVDAVNFIGELGEAALARNLEIESGLVKVLADESSRVRYRAVSAIGRLGPVLAENSEIVLGLAKVLADEDESVRASAAEAIGKLGPALARNPEIASGLLMVLADEDKSVRYRVADTIRALGLVLADDAAFVSSLLVMLTDNAINVRINAAETIGALGPALAGNSEIVLGLAKVLTDEESWVRHRATYAIGRLGSALARNPEIASGLLAMLIDENKYVRGKAAETIGALGPALAGNSEIESGLAKALRDENKYVRGKAAEIIDALGPALAGNSEIESGLAKALRDENKDVRVSAADAIGKLGPALAENPEIVSGLLAALADEEEQIKVHAIGAIGELGPALAENAALISGLLAGLSNKAKEVRRSAVEAIYLWTPTLAAMQSMLSRLLALSLPEKKEDADNLIVYLCVYLMSKRITLDDNVDKILITFFRDGESWQVARSAINLDLWQCLQAELQARRAFSDWVQTLVPRAANIEETALYILEQKKRTSGVYSTISQVEKFSADKVTTGPLSAEPVTTDPMITETLPMIGTQTFMPIIPFTPLSSTLAVGQEIQESIEQQITGDTSASNRYGFHRTPPTTKSYARVDGLSVEINYMDLSASQAKLLQPLLNGPKGYQAALCDKEKTGKECGFVFLEDEHKEGYQARLRLYFRNEVMAARFKKAVDSTVAELKMTYCEVSSLTL